MKNHIHQPVFWADLQQEYGPIPEDPREAAKWAVEICIKEFETAKHLPEHWR